MYNNDTMNEQINAKKIIDETVERILMERQQVFETKLKQQESEFNNKSSIESESIVESVNIGIKD
jgi:hypothetical protein